MSKQEALERYIQELFETDPEWEAKYAVTDDLVGYKWILGQWSLITCLSPIQEFQSCDHQSWDWNSFFGIFHVDPKGNWKTSSQTDNGSCC